MPPSCPRARTRRTAGAASARPVADGPRTTRVTGHGGWARRGSGPWPVPRAGRRVRPRRRARRVAGPRGGGPRRRVRDAHAGGGPRRRLPGLRPHRGAGLGGARGGRRPGRRGAGRRRPRAQHDHPDLDARPRAGRAPGGPATRSCSAGSTTTRTSGRGCSWPRQAGVLVRWAEVDIETGELPAWQYDELLTRRTRLVALTAASNAIGTCPDVRGDHRPGARGRRADLRRRRPRRAARLPRPGRRWARTSSRCRPTSGAARTSARSSAHPQLLAQLQPGQAGARPGPGAGPLRVGQLRRRAVRRGAGRRRPPGRTLRRRGDGAGGSGCAGSMAAVARYEGELFARLTSGLRSTAARAGARLADAVDADRRRSPCRGCGRGRSRRSWRGTASAPGTATTTRGSCSTRSASTTPAAPSGWDCCTTTPPRRSTGSSTPSPLLAPAALNRSPSGAVCRG